MATQPGPWEDFQAPSVAPVERRGRPRLPAPQTGTQADLDEARLRAANIQAELDAIRRDQARRTAADPAGDAGVDQRKNAGFYQRAARAAGLYEEHAVQPRGLVGQTIADAFPRAANVGADPERQMAEAAQRDFIAATLRYESGAAIPPSEFESQRATYFPQPGDSPETIALKASLRQNAIDALRVSAGQAANGVDPNPEGNGGSLVPVIQDIAAMGANARAVATGAPPTASMNATPVDPNLVQPGEGLGQVGEPPPQTDSERNAAGGRNVVSDEGGVMQGAADRARATALATNLTAMARQGESFQVMDAWLAQNGFAPMPAADKDRIREYRRQGRGAQFPGFAPPDIARDQSSPNVLTPISNSRAGTAIINFADSVSLGAPGLVSPEYRERLAETRQRDPAVAIPATIVGGLFAPGGPKPGMGLGVQSLRSAGQGAVYGFNSSGGDPASALAGGGIGAAVPPAFRVVQSAGRSARSAFAPGANYADDEARALATALDEEGIQGSRPLLDPAARTRMAYLESQRGSGGPIREGLAATREGVEGGVERIGAGGTAEPAGVMGTRVQDALLRDHRQQGVAAGRIYDAADAMAAQEGAPGIRAIETVAQLDNTLTRLRRNAPANQPIIEYLESVRANFVDADGNLITKSIADMRDIRTSVSGAINHRNLGRTRAEFYVTEALDAAKADVARDFGTTAPEALRLYNRADGMWTARQANRREILDRLIGQADNPLSGEQVMARLQTMAGNRGDVSRLERMWQRLGSQEQLDVAATVAEGAMSRSADEGFQLQNFVNWARGLSTEGRRVIFGPEASRSIGNLVRISKALQATEGALNRSRSGVVQNWAGAFRDFVRGGPVGAGLGLLGGGSVLASGAVGATLGATASLGGMALRRLSARSLMSPDLSRWLANAPRATTPSAIRSHIDRLNVIARARQNQPIAQEILGLRQALLNAANDNVSTVTSAAASGDGADPQSE